MLGGVLQLLETKWFARYARCEQIDDSSLREAIQRAERGLVDADLGGGIIKQRVARPGKGRSSGFRVLIAYHSGNRAVFLYGFAKSERANIKEAELQTLREIGAAWLGAGKEHLDHAIKEGFLKEIQP